MRLTSQAHQRAEALSDLTRLESSLHSPHPTPAMRLLLSRFLPLLAPPSDQPSAALNALRAFGLVEWCNRLERSRQGRGEDFACQLERRLHRLLNSRLHLPSLFNKKGATSASPISASIAQLEGGGGCRLELGCGGGEWLCAQAGASPEVSWLGLELMGRRAFETAARLALEDRHNGAAVQARDEIGEAWGREEVGVRSCGKEGGQGELWARKKYEN